MKILDLPLKFFKFDLENCSSLLSKGPNWQSKLLNSSHFSSTFLIIAIESIFKSAFLDPSYLYFFN